MDLHLLSLLTAANLAAVLVLTLVVAAKKATRNRAERDARERRERFGAVLAGGGDADAMVRLVREERGAPQAQEALLGVLVHEWDGVRLRHRHAFQDAVRGAGLVDALLALLAYADPVTRARAALLLGHMRLPEAVEPVAKLLDDGDGDVAHAAARALGRIGDDAAAWTLVRGLQRWCAPVPS